MSVQYCFPEVRHTLSHYLTQCLTAARKDFLIRSTAVRNTTPKHSLRLLHLLSCLRLLLQGGISWQYTILGFDHQISISLTKGHCCCQGPTVIEHLWLMCFTVKCDGIIQVQSASD